MITRKSHPHLKGLNVSAPQDSAEYIYRLVRSQMPKIMIFRNRRAQARAFLTATLIKDSHFSRSLSIEEEYWDEVRRILHDPKFYKTVKK